MIFIVSALSLHAQERPRYFENFDTRKGVQVQRAGIDNKTTAVRQPDGRPRIAPGHYLPSPGTGEQFKQHVQAGASAPTPLQYIDRTVASSPRFSPAHTSLAMKAGTHLRGFSTGDPFVDAIIVDSSRRYRIDPLLIFAQMGQESAFKKKALSHKGASGLMQLMPTTARRLGVTNIYDPQQNIDGGVKYMRMLLNMFDGDVLLALAGYNAGEGAVMRYGRQVPPFRETRDYVTRISVRYNSISKGRELAEADLTFGSPAIDDFRRSQSAQMSGSDPAKH